MLRLAPIARCGIVLAGFALLAVPELLRRAKQPSEPQRAPARAQADAAENTCITNRPPPTRGGQYFNDITGSAGLDFLHAVGPLGTYFMPEINGTGGALFDYDNDGDLDLYLVNAGRSPKAVGEFPPGTRVENRLFRQEPDGTFADVTAGCGLGDTGYGAGCAVGDVDNDGDLDLYVTNYGPDRLFQNNNDGTFSDITELAGTANPDWGTCAAFVDYDRDGRLDLFVVNYTSDRMHGHSVACGTDSRDGRVSYCGPLKFAPTVDRLFHNEGVQETDAGRSAVFREVTVEAGLQETFTQGFGVVCADIDRDGWPDLFVASDMSPNRLWINQRNGTFREEAIPRGAGLNSDGRPEAGMGAAVGDLDGDGDFDLLATHLTGEKTTLYRNDGAGMFRDAADSAGLRGPTAPHTGWGVALVDIDHDGDLDLPIANGLVVPCNSRFAPHGEDTFHVRREVISDPEAYWREYADHNLLLLNDGSGRFNDRTDAAGDFGTTAGSARALIYGDLDADGDIDLVVTSCGGPARIYRNDAPKKGSWLQVRAIDPNLSRDAYGAEVTVSAGGRDFLGLISPASSYLASNDARAHFGLGEVSTFDRIHVRWPDGLEESFPGGSANRNVVLRRGGGRIVATAE